MTLQATESFRSGMCVYTSRAIDTLKSGKIGDTITREQMQALIGRPVDPGTKGYGNVCSAIRHVRRTDAIHWEWDRSGKCWVRLSDEKTATSAKANNGRVRRMASKTLLIAACVDTSRLTSEQRRDLDLASAQAAMAHAATTSAMTKRLESSYKPGIEPPKIEDIAGLFSKK